MKDWKKWLKWLGIALLVVAVVYSLFVNFAQNKVINEQSAQLAKQSEALEVLVAERAAYYWTMGHAIEHDANKEKNVSEEYKFYVYEFNRNLEILRGLAIRNLPAQQVRLLAKKTINVIERICANPEEKDKIIKEIVHEFTIEVSNIGFKSSTTQIKAPVRSA